MESASRIGIAGVPGNGLYIVLYLQLEANRITDAKFKSANCGVTIASGSILTTLIKDRLLEDCNTIDVDLIIEALDGVPPHRVHGPRLAATALRNALKEADCVEDNLTQDSGANVVIDC